MSVAAVQRSVGTASGLLDAVRRDVARSAAAASLGVFLLVAVLGSPPARHLVDAPSPDAPVFADTARRIVAAGQKPGWWPGFEDAAFFEPLPAVHLVEMPRVTSGSRVLLDPSRPLATADVGVVEAYRTPGTQTAIAVRDIVVGDVVDVVYQVRNLGSETLRDLVIDDPVLGPLPVPTPLQPHAEVSVVAAGVTVPARVAVDELPRLALGTDPLGRDLAARLTTGAWRLLVVAGGAGALSFVLGAAAGWAAARRGGSLVSALGRARLVLVTFPFLLVTLVIVLLTDASAPLLVLLTATVSIPITGRRVRDTLVTLRRSQRVETAIASGRSQSDIARGVILPAMVAAAGSTALGVVAAAAIVETSLGFLGLGPRAATVSLGAVVADVRWVIDTSPGYLLLPGLLIVAVTLGSAILADDVGRADAAGVTGTEAPR